MEILCTLCKQGIKGNDDYCRITDYHHGLFQMECFYHTLCYAKQITLSNPEQVENLKKAIVIANRVLKEEGFYDEI